MPSVLPWTDAGPALLFTDLTSGPATGGEGGLGVFVTLHGRGFGGSRGDSQVTLAGREVARVVSWSAGVGPAPAPDRIVVQIGPGSASGPLVVTVSGRASGPLPFVVRAGAVHVVAPADSTARDTGPGTFGAPWKSLHRARDGVGPGDVVYLKGGVYAANDPAYEGWEANLLLDAARAKSGTKESPIAYVGYPGDPPRIGSSRARRGIIIVEDDGPMGHYVFANLVFEGVQSALPLSGRGHRIVGNELRGGGREPTGMLGFDRAVSETHVLGNRLVENGEPGVKLHHGIYLGGFGRVHDVDIGWNEVRSQHGGRGIQVFGHDRDDRFDDVRIHDNLVTGAELNGILVGGSDGGTDVIGSVTLERNVVTGAAAEGIRINDATGAITLRGNVVLGNAVAQLFFERAGSHRVRLEGNFVTGTVSAPCTAYGDGVTASALLLGAGNTFSGPGAPQPP